MAGKQAATPGAFRDFIGGKLTAGYDCRYDLYVSHLQQCGGHRSGR